MTPKEQEAVELLKKMLILLRDSQVEKASDYLADDIEWKTPLGNYDGKQDFVDNFKEPKDNPTFEEPQIAENDGKIVITRKGKKKLGFLNIKIVKTVEFNDQNKICKMTVARA